MLVQLSIRNFALIAGADITFHDGFTSVTGETGSGKSILLGALNLILGERADYSVVRDPDKKTVVEASFRIPEAHREWFAENDIDWDEATVIRREIAAQGKSRAFINDTPVQLTQLRELTEQLIYIHSQHQTLELKKPLFQLNLVDAFAGLTDRAAAFRSGFKAFKNGAAQLSDLRRQLADQQQEADYIRFQLDELASLDLEKHDYTRYDQDLARMGQLDDLRIAFDALANGLSAEGGPTDGIRSIRQVADKWKHLDPKLQELSERLQAVTIELDDLAADATAQLESLEADPEKQQLLTQLVDRYNVVLRKHHLSNQQELTELQESYRNRFESTAELEAAIAELGQRQEADHAALLAQARELHSERTIAAKKLEQHLQSLMADLKLPDACLQFDLAERSELTDTGMTDVQLLFSANAGMAPKPVDRTASGGELSRLMLAVQATMSDTKSLPTLILDEIDTGVSGEVALRIGKLLRTMGGRMQLFAITHLPQVAAKGHQQYEVSKSSDAGGTNTTIRELSPEERLDAIARLMSGDTVSAASIANAQILLD